MSDDDLERTSATPRARVQKGSFNSLICFKIKCRRCDLQHIEKPPSPLKCLSKLEPLRQEAPWTATSIAATGSKPDVSGPIGVPIGVSAFIPCSPTCQSWLGQP